MFKGYFPGYSTAPYIPGDKKHLTWAILKGHTTNRAGTVTLSSADPRDPPVVNFNYFDEGSDSGNDDLQSLVNAVKFVRDAINNTDRFFGFLFDDVTEVWPGPSVTGAALEQFLKNEAWGHHASCSCPIGTVLDSSLLVLGTSNLRVVDASVFPRIPGTFVLLPTYMVSEKAAQTILHANKT